MEGEGNEMEEAMQQREGCLEGGHAENNASPVILLLIHQCQCHRPTRFPAHLMSDKTFDLWTETRREK